MKKLFIGNLPHDTSEENIRELFSEYGTVRSIQLLTDIFTGKCRGFGFVEMEGHEARAALNGLNGKSFGGNYIKVKFEVPRSNQNRRKH